MRSLRATRTYGGPLLAILLGAAVTVASVLVGLGADGPGGSDGDGGVLLPLLLVAAVTLPLPALDLGRRRRAEMSVARVRGVHGPALVMAAAGPPVVAALLGAALGLGGAALVRARLADAWQTPPLGATDVGWAATLAAAGALLVAGCSWVVVREPLAGQLRGRGRASGPRTTGVVGQVAGIAVLVVAVVVGFRAATSDGAGVDAGVLAGSGLIGLAGGQVLAWTLPLAGLLLVRAAAGRSSGVLLGVRRATGADHAARLRAVVAGAVVALVAGAGVTTSNAWADQTARLRTGAPESYAFPDGTALDSWRLTRQVDPDGRWLMAATVSTERVEAELRVAYLDLERFPRVVGDFLIDTTGDPTARLDELGAGGRVTLVEGSALTLHLGPVPGPEPAPKVVQVSVDYLGDAGFVESVDATVRLRDRRTLAPDIREPVACADGCVLLGIDVLTRPAGGAAVLDGLTLGDTDLLEAAWAPVSDGTAAPDADPVGALSLRDGRGYVPAAAVVPVPVLSAGSLDFGDGAPQAPGLDGTARPLRSVGTRPALPLVEAQGLLGDLQSALAGAKASVQGVLPVVLARADTPADVRAALLAAGADDPTSVQSVRDRSLGTAGTADSRMRLMVALGAAALAALALLAGLGGARRGTRHDDAALRLIGLPRRQARHAALVEASLLAVATALAIAVGVVLACATVVDATRLVPSGATLPAVAGAWSPLLGLGGAAAVAVAVGVVLVAVRSARASPGSAELLDEARR